MRAVKFHPYGVRKHGLNTLFNEVFNGNLDSFFKDDIRFGAPAVNVLETEDDFKVELIAPGFSKEDFKVDVEHDTLTISTTVEKKDETTDKVKYNRREFVKRSFKRTFTLPDTVNTKAIGAKYENGILTLALPKKEEAKPLPKRMIEIA